ncbi:MAG: hypothetical protein HY593_00820 [Candidatus Omnitrophica bacterium]|nr:hypothetical protein [Candidatus Omnitrophota bacterium]
MGQAAGVELTGDPSSPLKGGFDLFFGGKASLIANGEFSDKIEVGGQAQIKYESAHAELGAFGYRNMFDDKPWNVDQQTSFGISNVSADQAGNVTLKFKFQPLSSLLGAEGSLDLAKASVLIAERIEQAYDKILVELG